MTDIAIWWLKGAAILWMMLGTALFLDSPEQKKKIKRHCASWKMLTLKFALNWLVIGYVVAQIAIEPVRMLWRNYAIGCYTGRGLPPIPDGLRNRSSGSASGDVARTAVELSRGPHSLVREEQLEACEVR